MPYCENCGHKLSDGANFCEECGAKVSLDLNPLDENSRDKESSFAEGSISTFLSNWQLQWLKASMSSGSSELGIIMTDVSALANQLSCSSSQLKSDIADYISKAKARNVHYHLLDIGNNGICSAKSNDVWTIVELLKQITSVACPKYLFILGNEEIINVMSWENECKDSDENVLADLPYVTLDTNSPWNGQQYDFSQVLRTGRLPSYLGESLDEFVKYFATSSNYAPESKTKPFGLSAFVWQKASEAQYEKISQDEIEISPNITLVNVSQVIPQNVNLFYFNLHGSNQTEFWYGQQDFSYPETFSPEIVKQIKYPFFLGVEACYGARYTQGLAPKDSIVLTAMQNRCLAFLGSSRIAYGPCIPPGTCADIIVGTFLKKVQEGKSAGDAYCDALSALMSEKDADDSTIKTLAEFSLYGDPSIQLVYDTQQKYAKGFNQTVSRIKIPMPDVYRAVKSVLIEKDCNVVKAFLPKLEQYQVKVKTSFDMSDYMQGIEPKYYKVGTNNLYQAVYEKSFGDWKSLMKIYFDGNGNIKKQLFSK
ncbi:zinc-ribbon domain-containing protein [Fibrobacter sp. UWB16]|uniref:zinc-ribbon domain-containing protein n=1 Tax=Fibrobacter sp. UWB16 TaxID=1945874 RepID=UPI000BDA6718|nr:zinc-ribbon domain-containing protein [Fibrobacter sp. UWB16]SOD14157.1 zinc-ribbon domain-containing protein [Fibrobacter sp. UWB16]